jgi:methyl-accepting chemotaxis protein
MLDKLTIGMRLLVALGLMSLLVVAVAFSGHLGLQHMETSTQEFLLRDAHLAEAALEARASTLELRRYEKDFVVNIGAPAVQEDAINKWSSAYQEIVAHLDDLDHLVKSSQDHLTLESMRSYLATYKSGLDSVREKMRRGDIATPQSADAATGVYKDVVDQLEETARAIGGASNVRMGERVALLKADARETHVEMVVASILAVGVAILMSVRLSRSITLPLRQAVDLARRIATGERTELPDVTATDEVGDLQRAMRAIAEQMAPGIPRPGGPGPAAPAVSRFCRQCGASLA